MGLVEILTYGVCVLAMVRLVRAVLIVFALRGFGDNLHTEVISESLPVQFVDGFLSDGEIARLKRVAEPKLKRSRVLKPDGKPAAQAAIRTSSTAFLVGFWLDPIIPVVKRKAARLVGVPLSHIENIQVVRYEEGEHYGAHLDAMDLDKFPQEANKGQRVATVLVYLNDIGNGSGKTTFPKLGVDVTPQRGRALYFRNTSDDGAIDPRSLHAGSPVEGEGVVKWAANIWVRDRPLPLTHR